MLIIILMILFTAIMLGTAIFLYRHRNKPFMVFHPEKDANLHKLILTTSYVLLILSILSLVAIVSQNTVLISIALLLGVIAVVSFELMLMHYFPKK
ncbi:hypothetical protein [Secundilactobacillus oryzae]|uniref:hypothetical protein n=1 Tax=Secundilactobacillus oryzae TaxID=1202668 RepID=UPI000552FA5E|nr:hypothetical protein [Secundilactobacillus oryzae]